ncbi:MAG: DUF2911 domain-containing protein [Bacteroidetes bacterium]|nr:DUF2911 domain-containing protein [Bacteroidota bacterium]
MNRNRFMTVSIFTAMLSVVSGELTAQPAQSPNFPVLRTPRISQGQKITQVIGLSEVTIYYHRPGVKGRVMWGPASSTSLQPYDTVWRVGANEPTLFTFSDEVTIAGKKMAAGTYRFVTIPHEKEWTCIFNSEVRNWGTIYQAQYDTVRFTVTPQSGPHEEWMSFSFTDLTPASATLVLAWEKMRIPFKIEFNTVGKLQASVGTWQILNGAARSAIDHNMYTTEAMDWADRSIAMNKNFNNLRKMYKAADPKTIMGFTRTAFTAFEKAVNEWKAGKPGTN